MRIFIALLFASLTTLHAQETVISGNITGSGGRPMKMAHVHLYPLNGIADTVISVEADADGRYVLKTGQTGAFRLRITGVDHFEKFISPILIQKAEKFAIDVRLRQYPYFTTFDSLGVIGSFNDYSWNDIRPFLKNSDGTYSVEIETPEKEISYQLVNAVSRKSINGQHSERFEYDGDGDYRSFLTPDNGRVKITFDPNAIVRDTTKSEYSIMGNNEAQLVINAEEELRKLREDYYEKSRKAGGRIMGKPLDIDYRKVTNVINAIGNAKTPFEKQLNAFQYLRFADFLAFDDTYDQCLAQQATVMIPAFSPIWQLDVYAIPRASVYASKGNYAQRYDFAEKLLSQQKSPEFRRSLLYQLAHNAGEQDDKKFLKKYLSLLETDFPGAWETRNLQKRWGENKKIAVGNIVPDFSLVSLDDENVVISRESMKGKVYLVDFWGTWCGPCISELPNLHKTYEKFKNRGLEIISLAIDKSPETVQNFRKTKKQPMPWLHAYLKDGWSNPVADNFEVVAVPKPVLIDKDGKIIALDSELRGDKLEKTLEKILGEQ